MIEKANKCNIPVISFCHNLESLALGQVKNSKIVDLFLDEIKILSEVDLCITISREESFILNNFGINNCYLPYHPVPSIYNRLQKIRVSQVRLDNDLDAFNWISNIYTNEYKSHVIIIS